jgi:hypothetical protein
MPVASELRFPVLLNNSRSLINVSDRVLYTVSNKQRSSELNAPRVG